MLTLILITSLKILFVYEAMKPGMILHWLCLLINRLLWRLPPDVYLWIRKPLTECIFCMSSFWGILFTWKHFAFTWEYLTLLFAIGGLNYLIGTFIGFIHWLMEEQEE